MGPFLHVSYILPESTFPCINFWQMKVDENHKQYTNPDARHVRNCVCVVHIRTTIREIC